MRIPFRDNLKTARKMLKAHRGRSYMTMLGIIIGITSVVTVASIGEGIKRQVTGQINHAGDTLIAIRPGADQKTDGSVRSLFTPQAIGNLSDKDVGTVKTTKHVSQSAPLTLVPGTVRTADRAYSAGSVVGVGNDLPKLVNQSVAYGTFFSDIDQGENVAVMGVRAAENLFDTAVPLGQTFTFRGQEFMVRGIFNEFSATPLSTELSYNDAIFIPYSTARKVTANGAQPFEILARADSASNVDATISALSVGLTKNHGDAQDFSVMRASESLANTDGVISLLTQLTLIAAGISLFVGGIGIMNITLVSVTERMHEIGIRKAVGATNRQILGEFVAEAIVLTTTGAFIGILISLGINLVLRILTELQPVIQWQAMVIATLISVFVGLVFGTVPALKAARKDPIAALRGE